MKKIIGITLIGAVMMLGACHKAPPPEQILQTIGNKPVPKWISSPESFKLKGEAEGYKYFFAKKTFPGNYQATNLGNTPYGIVCSKAQADMATWLKQHPAGPGYVGVPFQKFFILKAKEADGSIIQRAYCEESWKVTKFKPGNYRPIDPDQE